MQKITYDPYAILYLITCVCFFFVFFLFTPEIIVEFLNTVYDFITGGGDFWVRRPVDAWDFFDSNGVFYQKILAQVQGGPPTRYNLGEITPITRVKSP